MNESTRTQVREQANNRCEYCRLEQKDSPLAALHVEHIVPRKHGGGDEPDNLVLACIDCNLHKGPNLTGLDPATGEITPLYNPRSKIGRSISNSGAYKSLARLLAVGPPLLY